MKVAKGGEKTVIYAIVILSCAFIFLGLLAAWGSAQYFGLSFITVLSIMMSTNIMNSITVGAGGLIYSAVALKIRNYRLITMAVFIGFLIMGAYMLFLLL